MEYKISNRLRIGAFVLIVLGLLGVGYGFMDAYSVNEDNITEFLANEDHHGDAHVEEAHGDVALHVEDNHGEEAHGTSHAEEGHGMSHEEHVLHQIHNRPWSALYIAAFFFFMIALGVLAFYAVQ